MDKNKKNAMLIAGVTLLLMLIGATYAYFAANVGGGTNASINATTGTTDSLSFSVGKDINLHVTMDDFLEGMESPHGETTATATLKANNVTNQATGRYNVFFIIDNNDFEYSTEDGKTELLLKVTDPNGNEVMDITGLKRVENGFDITTRTGGFLIMADYDIEATPEKTLESQTWKLEVTFVNLDSDQNINKGKSLNGRFYITTEKVSTYELTTINAIETTITYNSITANLNFLPGTEEIEKYYYAIEKDTSDIAYMTGSGITRLSTLAINQTDYIESDESTYTFDNLEANTTYKVYSYAKDKYGINSNVYETSITTAEYELPKVINLVHSVTLNSINVTATTEGGSNEVSKYYFSKDNGVTWSEGQESNSYTFNNLLDTTEYKIKVKVSDTNDIYSTEYYEAISTTTYILPSITKVEPTKTYESISLTTTAIGGTNSVAKYYYKVGDNDWSSAQSTNTYTITNLTDNTTYQIKVKVSDINDRESNEYSLEVTTNEYTYPSVTATIKENKGSLIITATGTDGQAAIAKYMYSKDDGSNWKESTSNSYTFDNLTLGTKFYLAIKVVDSNGRESTIYKTTATTLDYDLTITTTYNGAVGAPSTIGAIANLTCTGATSTYNQKYNRVEISQINTQNAKCTLAYTNRTSKTYLNEKIISLAGTTQGNGELVHETFTKTIDNSQFTPTKKLEKGNYSNLSNDVTYAWVWDDTNKTWTSSNKGDTAAKTTSAISFTPSTSGAYQLCYIQSSEQNYDFARIHKDGVELLNLKGKRNTEYECIVLGNLSTTNEIKVTYEKDISGNSGLDEVTFYIESGSYKEDIQSQIIDTGYRYEGKNPNNYIWFNNELWRIIGVFDSTSHGQTDKNLVKLIRAYPIGRLVWDAGDEYGIKSNNWNTSSLKSLLNGAYYNKQDGTESGCYGYHHGDYIKTNCDYRNIGIDNSYRKMIVNATWYLGGYSAREVLASAIYDYERGSIVYSDNPTSDTGYIGLLYPSDYGYASLASNCARTTEIGSYNSDACGGKNWLYGHAGEWMITPNSEHDGVFSIPNSANVYHDETLHNGLSVRPVLYLESSVYVITGDGTETNPYIIGM